MDQIEKELGNLITEEGNIAVKENNGDVQVHLLTTPLNKNKSLQNWLDALENQKKAHQLFELEMWLKSFEVFFKVKNHPFTDQETKEIIRRNFVEELKISRNVVLRIIFLANELVNENLLDKSLSSYYESIFQRLNWADQSFESLLLQPTPEDSLASLAETLSDVCTIIDSLIKIDSVKIPNITLQAFTSIGKLVLREYKRSYHINLLLSYKFKSLYDRLDNQDLVVVIAKIDNEIVRQEITKVLLEFFRLLKYLDFVASDLSQDRPLKNCLPIFTLIRTEANQLIHFMDKTLPQIAELPLSVANSVDGCVYALQMDLKKVFGRELIGLVGLTQAPPIYAKVENSHGLLRDCFQQSVVTLVQIFEQGFDGLKIFGSFQTRLDQSLRLRLDIWRILCAFRKFQNDPMQSKIDEVNDQITMFRDTSLKYLMYKDWDDFEKMSYQAMSTRVLDDFAKTIHVFATFLEALLGQINMRAVLANHPFDYPEV